MQLKNLVTLKRMYLDSVYFLVKTEFIRISEAHPGLPRNLRRRAFVATIVNG